MSRFAVVVRPTVARIDPRRARQLWRLALGLALTALSSLAAAAPGMVDSIVVRYRDDALPQGAVALPYVDQLALSNALRSGFADMGRTTDGGYKFALNPPLALDEARAALNRIREDRAVLYAEIARSPVPARPALTRAKGSALSPPTARMIVKYKDPLRTQEALAGLALGRPETDRLTALAGTPVAALRPMAGGAQVVKLLQRMPVDVVEAIASRIAAQPDVEYAQPDYIDRIALTPTDACYASASVAACNGGFQWDLLNTVGGVNAPAAWNVTTGSSGIVVAVIDTGALFNHPDLNGRFVAGYDMIYDNIGANDNDPPGLPAGCSTNPLQAGCSSRDADASDPGDWVSSSENASGWLQGCGVSNSSWHGSHVAGTIGASPNNGQGIAGLNWVSKILPVRALGKCGGYTSDIADAMTWAAGGSVPGVPANPTPARVMNLSIGGFRPLTNGQPTCDPAYANAIATALSMGSVVAIAAGNSNYNSDYSAPGNCPGVITVAATGEKGFKAFYSNWGTHVEIAAPGGDGRVQATYNPNGRGILSSLNSGTTVPASYIYAQYQGTSMATPHIAGIASLMLSVNPVLTPAQVLSRMQTSARPFQTGAPACDTSNVPDINGNGSVPSSSWFACTCTTALCGAGFVDAAAAVTASIPPLTQLVRQAPDFSGDLRTDLVWTNSGSGASILWLMNGVGNVGSTVASPTSAWSLLGSGDFNGDGKSDLVWQSAGGATAIWLMSGLGPIGSSTVSGDPTWVVTNFGDFNGDLKSDIVWRNTTGATAIWLMNGVGPSSTAVISGDPSWTVAKVGDFNGDGKSDLLWHSSGGATAIWLMNGTVASSTAVIGSDPNWTVTHVGDFNGDGKTDLLWRSSSGVTALWLMNGTATTASVIVGADPSWQVTHVGDFNGDGKTDLVWRSTGGATAISLMNGTTILSTTLVSTNPNAQVVAVGDFNGDGKADIIWRDTATGVTSIALMNGTATMASATLSTDPTYSVVNLVK